MASSTAQSNRFYLLLGAVALAGIGALVYLVSRPKGVSIPVDVTVLAADTAGFRGYLLGSDTARLEISEYADFQCPACQTFETIQFPAVRDQLVRTGRVRWRYRDYPLDEIHPQARLAAHAAACAEEQGRYWEMHAALYQRQAQWSFRGNAAALMSQLAGEVGLDRGRYDDCMQGGKYAARIQASKEEGTKLGVGSTPTFLIGDRLYPGVLSSDSLRSLVTSLLAAPPPPPNR